MMRVVLVLILRVMMSMASVALFTGNAAYAAQPVSLVPDAPIVKINRSAPALDSLGFEQLGASLTQACLTSSGLYHRTAAQGRAAKCGKKLSTGTIFIVRRWEHT